MPSQHNQISNPAINQGSVEADSAQQQTKINSSNMSVESSKISQSPNEKPIPISLKIFQQKLKQAAVLKNNGNAAFKQKNYFQAIRTYSSALNHLDPNHFYGATQDQCKKMAELSSTLLCNIGYSYFNLQQWHKSDIYFSETLAINPKYIKALHKRALARFQLSKYQQAFQDIKYAFNLDKTNAQVHSAYKKILAKHNEELKKSKEQLKELSTKIFSKDSIKSQSSIQLSKKNQKNQKSERKQKQWSWPKILSLTGAAAFIGVSLFKAFKN